MVDVVASFQRIKCNEAKEAKPKTNVKTHFIECKPRITAGSNLNIMTEGKTIDEKDDDERLKKLMKAATGWDNVEEVRNKTLRDSKPSAKEFLADMEDDENVNQNIGEKTKIVAPSPKDDEILKSVSLSGPEPKPPAPRTLSEPLTSSSRSVSEEAEQSSNITGPSTSPAPQQQPSDDEEPNSTITSDSMTTKPSTDNDLNYKWISIIYAIGSLSSLGFYLLEEYGARPQGSLVASLNDLYIVFLPYIPCLIWTLRRLKNRRQNESAPIMDVAKKEQ